MTLSPVLANIRRKHLALLILGFILTRGLALFSGMRYRTSQTLLFWQFLDVSLLHHHLLRALLHLHSQPPLLNAAIGLAEKVAGPHYGPLLLSFQFLLGLSAVISVYLLLTRLCVEPMFSLGVSFLLLLNPAEIYFEFHSLYTSWVLAFHCFIALAIVCYVQSRSDRALYWLIGLAVCLTLLRSSYQWIWLVGMLVVLWWQLPGNRRQIRDAGLVGLLLALLWPAKNYVLFHHFTPSTWGPYSVSKHWNVNQPPVDAWVREGKLPTLTYTANSDQQLEEWLSTYWLAPPKGSPELDDISKAGGATNWNSLAMLRMNDAKAKDVSFLFRHDPAAYAVSVVHAVGFYFEPVSVWLRGFADQEQYRHIAPYDNIVRHLCCNIFGVPPSVEDSTTGVSRPVPPHTVKAIIQSFCVGALLTNSLVLLFMLSLTRPSLWNSSPDRKVAAMVMTVTITYAFLVVNLVDVGENMRFRFETEALVFVVAAIFLQQLWDRRTPAGK